MENKITILLSEDDEGHARLIKNNIRRAGINNEIIVFRDGKETLNFLYREGTGPHREEGVSYLLLLDLYMPVVDGFEVLKKLKKDSDLSNIPIVILSISDDPKQIEHCYEIGCSKYVIKPVDYNSFRNVIRQLSRFIYRDVIPKLDSNSIN